MPRIAILILDNFFNIAIGLLLLRLFVEEINPSSLNTVFKFLLILTEPVLAPIRKKLPDTLKDKFYIDISPVIACLLIIVLKILLLKILSILLLKQGVKPVKFKTK